MRDVILVVGVLAAIGLCLVATRPILRRFPAWKYLLRNLTHVLSGVLCAVVLYTVRDQWVALAVGLLGIPLLVAAIEFDWMPELMHGSRIRDYGFVAYAIGLVTVVALFFSDKDVMIAAMLVVGLADPLASIVGRRFGRHAIISWRCKRTFEGSIAFASIAFAISIAFFRVDGPITPIVLVLSAYVAFTTAALEIAVPSALDNLALPVWSAFLLFLAKTRGNQLALGWATAVLTSSLSAPLMYCLRWVDASGTVASMLVMAVAWGLGGWEWLVPMGAFFSSSSLLTKFRQVEESAKRPRKIQQVVVNGVIPMIPVLGYAVDSSPTWYSLYLGAVAVANADTWATEVGRFSRSSPISLKTLRPVPRGTSGAISFLGTLASILGGMLIGAAAAVFGPPHCRLYFFLTGTVVGPLGALIDSILGSWIQCLYQCNVCGKTIEEANHCNVPCQRRSGLYGFNNDIVNTVANIAGACISLSMYIIFL